MLEGQQGLLRHSALAAFACAGLALAVLVVPLPAEAHGLVQRANLPIPEWLFGWAAAIVLLVSFVALAVLWPEPRLERDRWRPLPDPLGRALASRGAGDRLRRGRDRAARGGDRGRAGRHPEPAQQLRPGVRLHHLLGRARVRQRPARRRVRGLQPLARARAGLRLVVTRARGGRAPRGGPTPSASGAGPPPPGCSPSPGSSWPPSGARSPARSPSRCSATPLLTLAAQARLRDRGLDAPRRGVRRLLRPLRAHGALRAPRRRGRRAPAASPASRTLDPLPGTVALVIVMIGTVTFDGLSQGQLWIDLTGDAAIDAPRLVATLGLALGVALVGGFYALGHRRRPLGRRRPERPAAAARLRPLARADRDGLRGRALPDLPDLRGPVDRLPRLRPARRGLEPVRHRHGDDRLRRAEPERGLVPAGRASSSPGTSRR